MAQVEFHILNEAGEIARLRHACQLIDQAYEQGQRSYVYAGSAEQAERMDDMLWTFRDQAFIPHELLASGSPSHPRIMVLIGCSADSPETFRSVLINLSDTLPEQAGSLTRICEVIPADPELKQLARERYKQYREQGCQLQTINQ